MRRGQRAASRADCQAPRKAGSKPLRTVAATLSGCREAFTSRRRLPVRYMKPARNSWHRTQEIYTTPQIGRRAIPRRAKTERRRFAAVLLETRCRPFDQPLHCSVDTCYHNTIARQSSVAMAGSGASRTSSRNLVDWRAAQPVNENKTRVGIPRQNARREDANDVPHSIAVGEQGE